MVVFFFSSSKIVILKCYGIKGPSLLLLLSVFNFVFGLPVDYMHCICLGVSKKLTSLWFDSKYSAYPWYLGKHLQEIDRLLLAITPPKFIKRTLRSLTEHQHWKASEYRNWLLYYAPVVLKGYLPPLYFHHFFIVGSCSFSYDIKQDYES